MAYKLMVIDDERARREEQYREVLSFSEFEPLFFWKRRDFEHHRNTPVDGYIIDIFLTDGDWAGTNAAELIRDAIQHAPRQAPIFLVSQLWGDERVLQILKQTGESTAKVVQYLAWGEFQQAMGDDDAAKIRMDALRKKLLFELDHWHGRSGFRPGPDDTIRILLLADIQFGDPETDPEATFAEHWIARTLKQDDNLPDLIVIAGDMSHSGRPDQFALAEERIELDLMGPLWGTHNIDRFRDRIVLVPGNHDVNLRFSACDNRRFNLTTKEFEDETTRLLTVSKERYLSHHDYALEPFRRFAHGLARDRNWQDSSSLSWVDRRFLHCGIRFFVMSSVTELNASMPDRASFSEHALREITRSIGDDEASSIFSIALSHHGVRPERTADDDVVINNWQEVGRSFFSLHAIRLWLFGHYHEFDASSINRKPFDKKPLWLLQVPTSRISSSQRGFCVLELRRKAGKVTDARVHHYVLEHSAASKRETKKVFGKG